MPSYDREYYEEMDEINKRDYGEDGYPEKLEAEMEASFSADCRKFKRELERIDGLKMIIDSEDITIELSVNTYDDEVMVADVMYTGSVPNKAMWMHTHWDTYGPIDDVKSVNKVGIFELHMEDISSDEPDCYLKGAWSFGINYYSTKAYSHIEAENVIIKITVEEANKIYKEAVKVLSELEF